MHTHDICHISITYSLHCSGEVLFNWAQPEEPPDFIFGPDDTDFEPDTEELKVHGTCIPAESLDNYQPVFSVSQYLLLKEISSEMPVVNTTVQKLSLCTNFGKLQFCHNLINVRVVSNFSFKMVHFCDNFSEFSELECQWPTCASERNQRAYRRIQKVPKKLTGRKLNAEIYVYVSGRNKQIQGGGYWNLCFKERTGIIFIANS